MSYSHPQCHVDVIYDSAVRFEFRVQGTDVQIVDVGSLTGTWVNRVPVDYATLADGDEVQLGKFRLIFLSPQLDTG